MSAGLMERKLIALSSPVSAQIENDEERLLKGFVSVEARDRQGHFVDPLEFDIKQFMAIPAMLLNHKYYSDSNGNQVGAGRPVELYAAKLTKGESDDSWNVQDLKTKEIRNTFPKEKVPNLKSGDRGLFIVAQVTQPGVWDMVKKGELNGFSWRGLTRSKDKIDPKTNTVIKDLSEIDIYEISFVTVPQNPFSGFIVVGKGYEALDEDVSAYAIKFSDSFFSNEEQIKGYMQNHRSSGTLSKVGNNFFMGLQATADKMLLQKSVDFPIAPGVSVIAAPSKESEYVAFSGVDIDKEDAESIKSLLEPKEDAVSTETLEKPVEKKEEVAKSPEFDVEKVTKTLVDKTAESVTSAINAAFKPFTDKLEETFKGLGEAIKSMTKTEIEKVEKEKEEEKQPNLEEVVKGFNVLSEQLGVGLAGMKNLEESIKGLAKSTPKPVEREEKIEAEKSVKDDPNSVFNGSSLWPYAGK